MHSDFNTSSTLYAPEMTSVQINESNPASYDLIIGLNWLNRSHPFLFDLIFPLSQRLLVTERQLLCKSGGRVALLPVMLLPLSLSP